MTDKNKSIHGERRREINGERGAVRSWN